MLKPLSRYLSSKDKYFFLLSLILLLGFVVRIYGINFGKPYLYHVDEWKLVNQAGHLLDITNLNKDVLFGLDTYPPFFTYILAFFYGFYSLIGLVFGFFPSLSYVVDQYKTNPFTFHLIGRLISAIMGTASIAFLYLSIRNLFNKRIAIIGALFFAFTFILVRNSHYCTVDVPATFFLLIAFYFTTRVFKENKIKDYILAGIFCGLAIATKYNVLFIVAPLFIVILYKMGGIGNAVKAFWVEKRILACGIALILSFIVACPLILIDTNRFIPVFQRDLNSQKYGKIGLDGEGFWSYVTGKQWEGFGHASRNSLAGGLGKPLMLLSLGGIVFCAVRHRKEDIILVAFPVLHYLLHGNMSYKAMRHLLPAIPFLVVSASILLDFISNFFVKEKMKNTVLAGCALAVALPMVLDSFQQGHLMTQKNTRTLASEWIEKNITPKTKIAVEYYYPQVFNSNENFPTIGPRAKDGTEGVKDYKYYDTQYLNFFWGPDRVIDNDPVQIIVENEIEYVIVDSWTSGRFYRASVMEKYPLISRQRRNFYDWIGINGDLLAKFSPQNQPGPTIKIYKVKSNLANESDI